MIKDETEVILSFPRDHLSFEDATDAA